MPKRVQKAVETKAEKIRMEKTKERRGKRESRKAMSITITRS